MFAKVFSQIFDSSIAEDFTTRHVFMDLLVLADSDGVIDMTLPAIARRTNVPLEVVQKAIADLEAPDPISRTKEHGGRRLIELQAGRGWGWRIVNYLHYRQLQTEESRRDYFREYRREARAKEKAAVVQSVHKGSQRFTKEEGDAEAEEEADGTPKQPASRGGIKEGRNSSNLPTTPQSKRIAAIFHRAATTAWSDLEVSAYKKLGTIPEADLAAVEKHYAANWPPRTGVNILRHDLKTLLNNWPGEVTRAQTAVTPSVPTLAKQADPEGWREWLEKRGRPYNEYRYALKMQKDMFEEDKAK